MNRRFDVHRASAGFGLVETMVALVIGLLATFIIMQIFASSEGQKRTITGSADAQSDAAVALYLMERDLRQAGYGFAPNPEDYVPKNTAPPAGVLTNGILAQCSVVNAYNSDRTTFTNYADSTFAPVVINPSTIPSGDVNTDVVMVNYSSTGGMIGKGIAFSGTAGTDSPDYTVAGSRMGFNQGDMILAVPLAPSVDPCTIGEVTGFEDPTKCSVGVPTTGAGLINHGNASYLSAYADPPCGPATAKWNEPGSGVTYGANSKLYNLGPADNFVSRVYAVRNGNLTMCDLTKSDCTVDKTDPLFAAAWPPIASGMVSLKALYGKDNGNGNANSDGVIDAWDADAPPTPAARAQVIAFRLAVAVRSGQYEKEEVTTASPVWRADAASTADIPLFNTSDTTKAPPADWKHYRYKVAQSIVPLRNMIWGEQLK